MLRFGEAVALIVAAVAGLLLLGEGSRWAERVRFGFVGSGDAQERCLILVLVLLAALAGRIGLKYLQQRIRALDERKAASDDGTTFESRAGIRWFDNLALFLLLFGGGAGLASHLGRPLIAVCAFAVLAWMLPFLLDAIILMRRPGPLLRMDTAGIRYAAYGLIPWRDVVGIHLQTASDKFGTLHTLTLGVRGAARYLRNAPPWTRWINRRLRHCKGVAALPLGVELLSKDPPLIHKSALALRRLDPAPFLEHWHPMMDDRQVEMMLKMQALTEEVCRIDAEVESGAPARDAALEARMEGHHTGWDAMMPEFQQAMDIQIERARRGVRKGRIAFAVILALLALSFVWRLMR